MAALAARLIRGEGGQAIIEMALTLPLLLLIVLGIFDFGFMFQKYEVVTNAAREGARVGVLPDYTAAEAESRAVQYLNVGLGGLPALPGKRACGATLSPKSYCASATPGTVQIPGTGPPLKTVEQVSVVVEYDYEFRFTGPLMNLFGGSLGTTRLRSVSTMRVESN